MTSPSQMEPMFPSDRDGALGDLALQLVRRSAALGGQLRGASRQAVVALLRRMNSYYSNLIEGHATHPRDIERALAQDYSADPARRVLQLEGKAHVEVQELIESRLAAEPDLEVCSADFLCMIHKEFYERMPPELRVVHDPKRGDVPFEPGALRTLDVEVGIHIPPTFGAVPEFLARFREAYSPSRLRGLARVMACAASHHRLAWIHPFLDGNGRVTRLFTHAYLLRAELDGHKLWTVTRGLGRHRDEYMAALTWADAPRMGDLGGRGNLSEAGLGRFCSFFLRTALDQLEFMADLLQLDGLEQRMLNYIERRAAAGELRPEARFLVRDVLLRGTVPRGEAGRITGLGERTARDVLGRLVELGLLVSDSPKGPVSLSLPADAVGYYFPRLYPPAVEMTLGAGTE